MIFPSKSPLTLFRRMRWCNWALDPGFSTLWPQFVTSWYSPRLAHCLGLIPLVSLGHAVLHSTLLLVYSRFHWYPEITLSGLVSPELAHGAVKGVYDVHPTRSRPPLGIAGSVLPTHCILERQPESVFIWLVRSNQLKSSGLVTNMDLSSGS